MKSTQVELKLPDNRKPSVLDRQTIWAAIKPGDYVEDESDKEYITKTTLTLRLEFKQLLKIDNLHDLTSLTRLFLDNNFIEKISGLDFLVNLVWLDLSFNKIRHIEGLDALKKLQVLALYQNEIRNIENLDHLKELNVLRVGNNRLHSKEDILYLRRLPNLRTLSIKGNPICRSEDWKSFAVALLPNLTYLEIHPVSQSDREESAAKYQGDILRAEGREEQEAITLAKKLQQLDAEKRHRDAFVETIKGEVLLANLKSRNANMEKQIENLILSKSTGTSSLKEQYEKDISELGETIHNLGLEELTVREREVTLFEESIDMAQKETQNKGVKTLDNFNREKENVINKLYDLQMDFEEKEEEITDLQREEVEKLRETFRQRAKTTWHTVMSQELTLVSQTEQVLELFESSLSHLIESFLSEVRSLFQHGRNIDIRYFKNLSQIGEQMEVKDYETSDCTPDYGRQSDSLLSLVAKCHDGHQDLLLQEEEKLHNSVHEWASEYLDDFRKSERERNRTRVLELNFFLDTMKREVEEIEVLPVIDNYEEDV